MARKLFLFIAAFCLLGQRCGAQENAPVADMADFKDKVKLEFVGYGSREIDGSNRISAFGGDPKANVEALKTAGVNAHFHVSPETAHEWQSWRRSLREFVPHLFTSE